MALAVIAVTAGLVMLVTFRQLASLGMTVGFVLCMLGAVIAGRLSSISFGPAVMIDVVAAIAIILVLPIGSPGNLAYTVGLTLLCMPLAFTIPYWFRTGRVSKNA